MEYRQFGNLNFNVSAVGLGTWVTGGWMWGGSDEKEVTEAIEKAVSSGITLIDTAPIYGFGLSEEIVGKTLRRLGLRDKMVIATKCGLEWDESRKRIGHNLTRGRILEEIDASRRRLETDVIDLYQVHWPDDKTPVHETMETLDQLLHKGVIRGIGLSNFDVSQIEEAMKIAPVHSLQPPYNLFERGIEEKILPFCREHHMAVLAYGSICRGLLSGKFKAGATFQKDDIRAYDPKFKADKIVQYMKAVSELGRLAGRRNLTVAQLAIQWAARQPGVTAALVGARNARQAEENAAAFNGELADEDFKQIDQILEKTIKYPVGPEFMAGPAKKHGG
ncbi:MAG: general stress protein [Omnitrophica bacterium RIFCSPLOWO2_12_FULL_44_17]|uniref:General stress protein n=1 Tax=Candidatus Danuiimicrobium aquiferis TaxID=1801832 RepID=A0A1G1L1G2_9BACT|nr:MAG: general stress protein [Omnitrophica bacterium RIFCSPHIGHO2_02_FULL_45_28]OGW89943.1 MAG: general stress protein [Omnitrophica bacterium RIFCSPHIGHO2_12_FULL_44_12]OGW98993.1 MAG: general stress protein [Omnitrophica bacterium RIFCSPLOWO2_12_FULL_44_17]OGX04172.1 MAG: general stress protein [Omnitrophica bacterium RIFCSPLOWO2_02_FULL_44_11]